MRVLHVVQAMSKKFGGVQAVLHGLAKAQAQSGLKVEVATTNIDTPMGGILDVPTDRPVEWCGIKIHYFPVQNISLLFSFPFRKYLKSNCPRFDIIHIHGLYRFPVTYAGWLARKKGVPYIIRPHGSLDPFLYKQSSYGQWALPLKRLYENLFDIPNLHHASAIHYTAQEEMERVSFLKLRTPAVIIPNGIDWQQYAVLPEPGTFREHIGLDSHIPLVLFLGRINFKKGLDLLVPSFARVVEKFPDAHLAIVGPDNEGYGRKVRQWCREQGIEDKVFFVDHLGPEEVKQAYVDADVFVLSSYTENFGMTVVEAMACGCPVVISDQVNIWREVEETGAGVVVGLDVPEIAKAICTLLGDMRAAKEMGLKGRIVAEKRYSWPRIVEQMTDVYRELVGQKADKKRLMNR